MAENRSLAVWFSFKDAHWLESRSDCIDSPVNSRLREYGHSAWLQKTITLNLARGKQRAARPLISLLHARGLSAGGAESMRRAWN